jgi:hypothetical protein
MLQRRIKVLSLVSNNLKWKWKGQTKRDITYKGVKQSFYFINIDVTVTSFFLHFSG